MRHVFAEFPSTFWHTKNKILTDIKINGITRPGERGGWSQISQTQVSNLGREGMGTN